MKHDTFAILVAHYGQAVIYRTPEVGRIEREVIAAYDRLNAENERLRVALEAVENLGAESDGKTDLTVQMFYIAHHALIR